MTHHNIETAYRSELEMLRKEQVNVGPLERWISMIAGALLAYRGFKSRNATGVAKTLAGGYLMYRGKTGHCNIYETLGVSTAGTPAGIELEESVTINRSPEDLYQFWRNLENLPNFMEHLESVKTVDARHSHWIARTPGGIKVEWDSEITENRPNELIGWRSLPASDIRNEGVVIFRQAPGDRGTEMRVHIIYHPPGGSVGTAVANFLNSLTSRQIGSELKRFKNIMETGEVPTIHGQVSGAIGE